ncbi:MAG: TVP38/TMEM64 family protein [Pseudomonadota bacterium]
MTMERSKLWIKILILLVFAGGLIGFFALGGDQWLTLENLKAQRNTLLAYSEQHYALMLAAAVLIYMAFIALSIPGAVVLSLAMGFIFGRWAGTLAIVVAATLGATLVFVAARYLFADAVQRRLRGVAKKFSDGFRENAFNYMLFLRLVPVFPFWLINLIAAVMPITLRTFVVATAVGIIPGTFVFANLGQSLGRIDALGELLSLETLGAFLLLGVFSLIPVFVKKMRIKKVPVDSLRNST